MVAGEKLTLLWATDVDAILSSFMMADDGRVFATGWHNGVFLAWSLPEGKELAYTFHDSAVLELAMSRDGKYLASSDSDGITFVWDLEAARSMPGKKREPGKPAPNPSRS